MKIDYSPLKENPEIEKYWDDFEKENDVDKCSCLEPKLGAVTLDDNIIGLQFPARAVNA